MELIERLGLLYYYTMYRINIILCIILDIILCVELYTIILCIKQITNENLGLSW